MDRPRWRILAVTAAGTGVMAGLGVGALLITHDPAGADPLSTDAPFLTHFRFEPTSDCTFEPDRGGLVAHFAVRTSHTGRLTVDVEAVPHDGVDDLDVTTQHAVRLTVPFFAGQTRKDFDVVVPLTAADYAGGYRECRFTLNPTGPG